MQKAEMAPRAAVATIGRLHPFMPQVFLDLRRLAVGAPRLRLPKSKREALARECNDKSRFCVCVACFLSGGCHKG
jgi:hypothetical protein